MRTMYKKKPMMGNSCNYISTNEPGELVGIDLLNMGKNDKVIILINYFSRKIYAKTLKTKKSTEVLRFIKKVYVKFPFKMIISDNGREFSNCQLDKWLNQEGIVHKYSIPYYHKSNGRLRESTAQLELL